MVEGLEGKLKEVRVGDIIILNSDHITVSGYVVSKSNQRVTLSQVDPNSSMTGKNVSASGFSVNLNAFSYSDAGDRTYYLRKFTGYTTLKKTHDSRELQEVEVYKPV